MLRILLVALLSAGAMNCAAEASAEQLYNKGTNLFEQGKYNDAVPLFTQAIEMESEYFAAYINRGSCYMALTQYDKAIEDFDRAHELNPKHLFPFVNRGKTYRLMGRLDDAARELDQALVIDPTSKSLFNNAPVCGRGLSMRLAWLPTTLPTSRTSNGCLSNLS